MKLVRMLSSMIYRLMTKTVHKSQLGDLERCIKAYLNRFCEFDELVYPKNSNKNGKASWLAKYNFPCLLNLIEVMHRYGPLRNLWEGGYQGEGYLRKTKTTLNQGLRTNWQVNSLQRMLELTAMDIITERTCLQFQRYNARSSHVSDTYVYSGIGMVHRKYSEGGPLSLAKLSSGEFGCLLRNVQLKADEEEFRYKFVEMERVDYQFTKNGMDYFRWKFDLERHTIRLTEVENIEVSCLLLPNLVVKNDSATFARDGLYAIVTSEWEEMLRNGAMGLQPWP